MTFTDVNFGKLLHLFNNELGNKIGLLEKQNTQIVAAKSGITFNQTCLNEGLCPIFTNTYICVYIYIYILIKINAIVS